MTELAEPRHPINDEYELGSDENRTTTFVSFVHTLEAESERLRSLAEACRQTTHELAERETRLNAREHTLKAAQQELETRQQVLDHWQQQLEARAAEADHAKARIAEAAEREEALKALAHDLLRRYTDS
jgi:peptidoglycan hydrolase CwlO-like protein